MINSSIRDFFILCYIESLKLKNNIKDSFNKPVINALESFFSFLVRLLLIILIFKINGETSDYPYFGALVMFFLLIATFICLVQSDKYISTQFTISHIHYSFPSPMSSRTIYAFIIFKSSIFTLSNAIYSIAFYRFLLSNKLKLQTSRIIYLLLGIFLIAIILKSFSFFLYRLINRFNINKQIKNFSYVSLGLLAVYLFFSAYKAENKLLAVSTCLNGQFFSSIPVLGWAKTLIICPNLSGNPPIFQTLALIIATILIIFPTIYFAVDYYEDAYASTKETAQTTKINKNFNDLADESDKKLN